jgi:hypothetical protein
MADPDPVAPRPVVQNFQPARRQVGDGPDTDLDGLSDDFETNVFGSDPKQPDKDGDGLSDWAEYWVDTNPNDADTDGDKWTDGEDLVFGDPLRQNAGGAERAKFLADARRQFDAEGSDRDKDFARDHLEKEFGTKSDNPDSDNDGLGDMIELQLKTNPMSPAGDTGDLDAARQQLGERRWAAEEAARDSSGSSLEPDQSTDSFAVEEASSEPPGFTDTVSAGAAYEAPVYQEPFVNDATGDVDGSGDGSFDAWA